VVLVIAVLITAIGGGKKEAQEPNFNRFSIYCTCVDHTFVHNKATRDFGYQPIFSTEEAFKITLDWLKTKRF